MAQTSKSKLALHLRISEHLLKDSDIACALKALENSPLLKEGFPKLPRKSPRKRDDYKCGNCGQKKRNHSCSSGSAPQNEAYMSPTSDHSPSSPISHDALPPNNKKRKKFKPLTVLLENTPQQQIKENLEEIKRIGESNVKVDLKVVTNDNNSYEILAEAHLENDKRVVLGQLSDTYRDTVRASLIDLTFLTAELAPLELSHSNSSNTNNTAIPADTSTINDNTTQQTIQIQLILYRDASWRTKRLSEKEWMTSASKKRKVLHHDDSADEDDDNSESTSEATSPRGTLDIQKLYSTFQPTPQDVQSSELYLSSNNNNPANPAGIGVGIGGINSIVGGMGSMNSIGVIGGVGSVVGVGGGIVPSPTSQIIPSYGGLPSSSSSSSSFPISLQSSTTTAATTSTPFLNNTPSLPSTIPGLNSTNYPIDLLDSRFTNYNVNPDTLRSIISPVIPGIVPTTSPHHLIQQQQQQPQLTHLQQQQLHAHLPSQQINMSSFGLYHPMFLPGANKHTLLMNHPYNTPQQQENILNIQQQDPLQIQQQHHQQQHHHQQHLPLHRHPSSFATPLSLNQINSAIIPSISTPTNIIGSSSSSVISTTTTSTPITNNTNTTKTTTTTSSNTTTTTTSATTISLPNVNNNNKDKSSSNSITDDTTIS
eukprot:TRINITY_DN1700_c0_g1_i3.p1 TRINITY_DN1700_c0_g1~~TRINITY_DN1700_c0_g1_i3.p1  ORF type:complete len:652 (+),score=237.98 TRINITY_DN1700_c0_g1_i3:1252-3207(+)